MREAGFRRSLTGRLSGRSIDSYIAYCRRVERELALDLDTCDLGPGGLQDLLGRLCRSDMAGKSLGNCVSALRAYAAFDAGAVVRDAWHGVPVVRPRAPPPVRAGRSDPPPHGGGDRPRADGRGGRATVVDLLATYGEVMGELRRRGVLRTGNSPVGDYAELLFSKAFDWTLNGNSASGHDAEDQQHARYQIKGRRLAHPKDSRQLGAIRRIEDRAFDFLAAVLFDPAFGIHRAAVVPHEVVRERGRRSDHTNSWIFHLNDRVWEAEGVRDVSDALRAAALGL